MILRIELRADKDSSVKDDVLDLLNARYDVQSVKWVEDVTPGILTSEAGAVAKTNIAQTSRWQG
jgi:hypothetical protein